MPARLEVLLALAREFKVTAEAEGPLALKDVVTVAVPALAISGDCGFKDTASQPTLIIQLRPQYTGSTTHCCTTAQLHFPYSLLRAPHGLLPCVLSVPQLRRWGLASLCLPDDTTRKLAIDVIVEAHRTVGSAVHVHLKKVKPALLQILHRR